MIMSAVVPRCAPLHPSGFPFRLESDRRSYLPRHTTPARAGNCGAGADERERFLRVDDTQRVPRRASTIAGGNASFVTLLVDYLRMVNTRQVERDTDRERLGLAVAAPHS